MAVIARRAVLAGAGLAAAGTVAALWLARKPPPRVLTLTPEGQAPHVALQTMSALVPTDPPRPVAELAYVDAAGARHLLSEFAGRGVVLNLWATWCAPCVAELPSLAALARAVANEPLVVLPLSTDRGGAAVVTRFYQEHGITGLPVALDPKGAVTEAVGARGLPTTLIIDRAGHERARLEGAADWASAEARAAISKFVG
jgi:thiol-disulfide isomerase/thioredoxin